MPDYSITLPHITEVAITKAKEILAFSTLPYYQASGVLKDAEGAVAIGDPIAWDVATKEYIKYDGSGTEVTAEAIGTGDSTQRIWSLINGRIKRGSYAVYVNAVEQTEWTDYTIDLRTGVINFFVAPTAVAITADYFYFDGSAKETAVGFVRIPGDSTDKAVAIEVLIGGAVKYAVVAAASNWEDDILDDLGAKYWEIADALIW